MSVVCKQTWNIESTVDITGMTPRDLESTFRQARGDAPNLDFKQFLEYMVLQNKTATAQFQAQMDAAARLLIRYREFSDLGAAQQYISWYTNSCGDTIPTSASAQFSLVKSEVLSDTALDQITP